MSKLEPTRTYSNLTATDELRRLLDEHEVEWWDMSDEYEWYTEWVPEMLVKHHHRHRAEPVGFFESTWRKHGEMANGLVLFGNKHHRHCIYDLTPEQAIAATLGSSNCTDGERTNGTCHNISKIVDKYGQARFACSECGAWLDSRMLWNPECSNGESPWVKDCKLNFCPNCGRKVMDE